MSAGLARHLRWSVHDRGRVIVDLAVMIADGGEAICDIDVLRDQGEVFGPVASDTKVWRALDEIDETRLRRIAPTLGPSHYCIIVTRGHRHDEEALYHLATTASGYVGMIGSKRKIRLIFDDLIARGVPAEALQRVHAPLGFDVGSQTVPEIAISIVAELIARRNLGPVALAGRPHGISSHDAPARKPAAG